MSKHDCCHWLLVGNFATATSKAALGRQFSTITGNITSAAVTSTSSAMAQLHLQQLLRRQHNLEHQRRSTCTGVVASTASNALALFLLIFFCALKQHQFRPQPLSVQLQRQRQWRRFSRDLLCPRQQHQHDFCCRSSSNSDSSSDA